MKGYEKEVRRKKKKAGAHLKKKKKELLPEGSPSLTLATWESLFFSVKV